MGNSQQYQEYLKSEQWQIKRSVALQQAEFMCEHCGDTSKLEVHHKTYERLYKERLADLEVLCSRCHERADRERDAQTTIRQRWKAIDTFMSKKYDEDWTFLGDPIDAEEEFDEWLDAKKDDW